MLSPGTNLYDLGCSTCNSFLQIDPLIAKGVNFVGTDASEAMIAKAKEKLASRTITHPCELICSDLNDGVSIENASVVHYEPGPAICQTASAHARDQGHRFRH